MLTNSYCFHNLYNFQCGGKEQSALSFAQNLYNRNSDIDRERFQSAHIVHNFSLSALVLLSGAGNPTNCATTLTHKRVQSCLICWHHVYNCLCTQHNKLQSKSGPLGGKQSGLGPSQVPQPLLLTSWGTCLPSATSYCNEISIETFGCQSMDEQQTLFTRPVHHHQMAPVLPCGRSNTL